MSKPKIFVIVSGRIKTDVTGVALAEDGHVLAGHWSSGPEWLRHDMGITGNWKHEKYNAHYADGWELVDLIDAPNLDAVPEYMAAVEKNRALALPEISA